MKRIRLTGPEIIAILGAAGNVDVGAMAEDYSDEKQGEQFVRDYHNGMDKLREMNCQPHRWRRSKGKQACPMCGTVGCILPINAH